MWKQKKRTQNTHKHPCLSGIRTHDLSVGAGEDSSCLRPRGHCDRQLQIQRQYLSGYAVNSSVPVRSCTNRFMLLTDRSDNVACIVLIACYRAKLWLTQTEWVNIRFGKLPIRRLCLPTSLVDSCTNWSLYRELVIKITRRSWLNLHAAYACGGNVMPSCLSVRPYVEVSKLYKLILMRRLTRPSVNPCDCCLTQ
jgi:hypothetical protein